MVREVIFYKTSGNRSPINEFLDTLSAKQAQKVSWVLNLIEELNMVPGQYFQKMVSIDDIWEARVKIGSNIFRLLGFFDGSKLVVMSHAFQKKTQKTPRQAIKLAEERKKTGLFQEKEEMSDVKKYIKKRKDRDPEFAKDFDSGYEQFKIGVMLKQAREEAGITQEELATRLHTKKTAISRIENHAEDIKLSTLEKFAHALGKHLKLEVA